MKIRIYTFMIFALFLVLSPSMIAAGETDPKDGLPAPGGTDAFLFYYRNLSGNQYNINGVTATKNAELTANLAIARYVHYWNLKDWTVAANIIQPYGNIHTELVVAGIDQESSGMGDTTGNITVWSPAILSGKDYSYWLAAGIYVTGPTGKYDQEKIVNIGANRWNYRFEIVPVALKYGPFTLEILGDLDIYSHNKDYTASGLTLEQDPVWSVYGHITYEITKTFWIGASYFYHTGGETTVNGVEMNDKITEHKIMCTTAFQTTPQTQLMLQYATDIHMENGMSTDAIQARFAYFW